MVTNGASRLGIDFGTSTTVAMLAGADGRVVVLDAAGRRPVASTGPTGAPIQSLAFSPAGAWLGTGDSRGMIRLHPIRR
ncbi:hypothetical protein AB0H83_12805 [Dactylosporangium sp. NPDC050688]|uniref:hypothetical protein n=1 Tax=Dactylosporangium sp. NPDC050688 TaxID=3157217 RepID=UPI00340E5149